MHYINPFISIFNQEWRLRRLPSLVSLPSYSFIFKTLAMLGIAMGSYAIYLAWNTLRERKIVHVPKQDQAPVELTQFQQEEIKEKITQNKKELKEEEPVLDLYNLFYGDTKALPMQTDLPRKTQKSKLPLSSKTLPFTSLAPRQQALNPAKTTKKPIKPLPRLSKEKLFEKFYLNQGRDIEGRTLLQIQNMNFNKKESCHNYIQWLFPTDQASKFNHRAPQFDMEQFEIFSQNATIKENVKLSFLKMLEFYGLEYQENTMIVQKRSNFDDRAKNWLTKGNHNLLRISRILRSLNLFGLITTAQALQQFLMSLQPHPAITKNNMDFWTKAIQPIIPLSKNQNSD